jgi:hypothetical protein
LNQLLAVPSDEISNRCDALSGTQGEDGDAEIAKFPHPTIARRRLALIGHTRQLSPPHVEGNRESRLLHYLIFLLGSHHSCRWVSLKAAAGIGDYR